RGFGVSRDLGLVTAPTAKQEKAGREQSQKTENRKTPSWSHGLSWTVVVIHVDASTVVLGYGRYFKRLGNKIPRHRRLSVGRAQLHSCQRPHKLVAVLWAM